MSSPQPHQSQALRGAARRRQRSTRLIVATFLLAIAAAVVSWSLIEGALVPQSVAAVSAVVLGVAAARIVHSELMTERRSSARDRARLAAEYAVINERHVTENAIFAEDMRRQISERQEAIDVLEIALSKAQRLAADQTLKLGAEARRADGAERSVAGLARALEAAEARSGAAEVMIVELEAELDVLKSEVASLKAASLARTTRSA